MTNGEEVLLQRDLFFLARGFSRRVEADNDVFHSTILMETI
jgi:hypothetical protein